MGEADRGWRPTPPIGSGGGNIGAMTRMATVAMAVVVAAVAAVHLAVSARGSRCQHEGGRHGAWEAACGGGDECGGVEGGDGRISDGGGCQGGGGGGDGGGDGRIGRRFQWRCSGGGERWRWRAVETQAAVMAAATVATTVAAVAVEVRTQAEA